MDDSTLVRQLINLGLNGYEARAYIALTERGTCTAADVARISGLPRQRIYDVLAALVERGLASTRPGSVVRYVATEPAHALDGLVAAQRRHLAEIEADARVVSEILSPLYQAGQMQTDPMQYIEVLRDRRAINARFEELQAAVQQEILVFNKPPYARQPQENTKGLGVARSKKACGLYEFSLFDDPAATEGVRRFCQAGEDVRVVPELPLKLVIIDESIVMFGMVDPVAASSELTIMVVQHPSLARVLKTAFDAYWAQGVTFDDAYQEATQRRAASA